MIHIIQHLIVRCSPAGDAYTDAKTFEEEKKADAQRPGTVAGTRQPCTFRVMLSTGVLKKLLREQQRSPMARSWKTRSLKL